MEEKIINMNQFLGAAHGGNVVYQSVCFCLQHDIADCCSLTRSCHDRNTHCIAGELAE